MRTYIPSDVKGSEFNLGEKGAGRTAGSPGEREEELVGDERRRFKRLDESARKS